MEETVIELGLRTSTGRNCMHKGREQEALALQVVFKPVSKLYHQDKKTLPCYF